MVIRRITRAISVITDAALGVEGQIVHVRCAGHDAFHLQKRSLPIGSLGLGLAVRRRQNV